MAFLCPVRIRRSKKKGDVPPPHSFFGSSSTPVVTPSPGRITGSSSIETLVRVGLEKEAGPSLRMTVLHDFSPCVDDELSVRRGDVVSLLYREHDWAYVIDCKTPPNEGFIPFSYVSPLKETSDHRSSPVPFPKTPSEIRYLNLYAFTARDENDLSLERGAVVTVLNSEDPDWFWVIRPNGDEGFVPSAFLHKMSKEGQQPEPSSSVQTPSSTETESQVKVTEKTTMEGGPKGVELVMLYDYKAQAADDLSVKRGDWVHADLSLQSVEGWLWAYAPKQKKYGFIPRAYARLPAMTSL